MKGKERRGEGCRVRAGSFLFLPLLPLSSSRFPSSSSSSSCSVFLCSFPPPFSLHPHSLQPLPPAPYQDEKSIFPLVPPPHTHTTAHLPIQPKRKKNWRRDGATKGRERERGKEPGPFFLAPSSTPLPPSLKEAPPSNYHQKKKNPLYNLPAPPLQLSLRSESRHRGGNLPEDFFCLGVFLFFLF